MPLENITYQPEPKVPPLRKTVHGRSFGGQFWSDQDYELTLAVTVGAFEWFTLTLLDPSGAVAHREQLGWRQAGELIDAAAGSTLDAEQPLPSLPGITREAAWVLGNDQSDQVRLGAEEIREIAAWMTYATRRRVWDFAARGDEWTY